MPFILGFLALIGAAYFWASRLRNASAMTHEIAGVASDVMAAARRFGFKRKLNIHPVESLDNPDIAIAATGMAFLELGGLPSAEQQDALIVSLQSQLALAHDQAQEAVILGRWLVTESGGAQPGLTRLTRRLYKMQGGDSFTPLMSVLGDIAKSGRDGLSDKQRDALDEIKRLYRIT